MDVVPFRWLLGGGGGGGSGGRQPRCAPLVLVLVHSATAHAEHRRLIRDTWGSWGSAGRDVLVRFLVGLPATSEEQATLEEEAAAHGDLVQGNFVDAYRNMTYKHVMALKWFATRCPDATYVLKVDDDVLVNTPVLLDFVWRTLSPFGARRLLACSVLTGSLPKRSYRSKWRVSFKEYSRAMYPRYCAGWAVLYSPDVAMRLYREMQGEPFFWIDDVLVTGLLPERLGITHVSWASLFLKPADLQFVLAGEVRPSFMLALWENVGMDMDDQRVIWRRILDDEIANSSASYVATVSDKERLRQSSPTRVR
ncbi:hypothetical protein ONE63_001314 [Megalurothrips usitatus]|uniref:Hexosyltransferase n=1 Tax=Megalurothrips usitatus TaxID=439358 RepID=A0AAV7XBP7_9NEOP|nr:hypothetical protein ONE63_001314 [Megalurothrips usitatus]